MESINPYVFIIQYLGKVVNCYFRKNAKNFAKISVQVAGTVRNAARTLFHKLVNGLAQIVDGLLISGGYRIHHAVTHVIF